jgi:hypothetical protein
MCLLHASPTLMPMPLMEAGPMTTDMRQRAEEDRALRWLKRRLEWENILSALREAGQGRPAEPTVAEQEPAAA